MDEIKIVTKGLKYSLNDILTCLQQYQYHLSLCKHVFSYNFILIFFCTHIVYHGNKSLSCFKDCTNSFFSSHNHSFNDTALNSKLSEHIFVANANRGINSPIWTSSTNTALNTWTNCTKTLITYRVNANKYVPINISFVINIKSFCKCRHQANKQIHHWNVTDTKWNILPATHFASFLLKQQVKEFWMKSSIRIQEETCGCKNVPVLRMSSWKYIKPLIDFWCRVI